MKKFSHALTIFVLATSFIAPAFVVGAQSCNALDGPQCPTGYTCSSGDTYDTGTCVSSGGGGGSGDTPGSVNQTYLRFYYDLVLTIVNSFLVPILIAVAFIMFLWGAYKYFIWGAESESEKADGRKFVMWGVIGLVIIFSTWALVNIVKTTIIPSNAENKTPPYPKL